MTAPMVTNPAHRKDMFHEGETYDFYLEHNVLFVDIYIKESNENFVSGFNEDSKKVVISKKHIIYAKRTGGNQCQ